MSHKPYALGGYVPVGRVPRWRFDATDPSRKLRARRIDVVAPRISAALGAAARRLFPFGLGRQPRRAIQSLPTATGSTRAHRRSERERPDGCRGRPAARPFSQTYGAASSLKHGVSAARPRSMRQSPNRGRRIAGRADEPRVFVVRHRKAADEELADVDAMDRALVFLGVRGAHQEIAGGNPSQIQEMWRASQRSQYSRSPSRAAPARSMFGASGRFDCTMTAMQLRLRADGQCVTEGHGESLTSRRRDPRNDRSAPDSRAAERRMRADEAAPRVRTRSSSARPFRSSVRWRTCCAPRATSSRSSRQAAACA